MVQYPLGSVPAEAIAPAHSQPRTVRRSRRLSVLNAGIKDIRDSEMGVEKEVLTARTRPKPVPVQIVAVQYVYFALETIITGPGDSFEMLYSS
ncbi:hypothetical protein LOK49_LG02G02606 [Camellia lanceoleosa]|uniref:Uncharacterized protein n=1 Tax=Camellia lanceoleosa TaxID=1840588 RepID=A0ACC0IQZ7_9ERIC|nr:hypothetical protein LOK49_LG02G02606 [Camellia lanceoleosa]